MIPLRDENPRIKFPLITILLIISNVLVFVIFMLRPETRNQFILNYALFPSQVHNLGIGIEESIGYNFLPHFFTYMFMHASWMHLIGNCWFLWIFGDNVEGVMGSIGFLIFYFICGILSALVHIVTTFSPNIPIIGASGAVAGVMGAYLILFPKAKIYTFVPFLFIWVIPIPAFIFLIMWFGMQLLNGLTNLITPGKGISNIAFWAHIGGFVIGIVGGILYKKRMIKLYRNRYYRT